MMLIKDDEAMALLNNALRTGLFRCSNHRYMFVVFITMLAGCHRAEEPAPRDGQQIAAVCPSSVGLDYFLPAASIDPARDDHYLRGAFSSYLRTAELMPLWCGQGEGEAYRLLYLPSGRSALIVQMKAADDDWLGRQRWDFNLVRFEDPRSKSSGPSEVVKIIERQNGLLSSSEINQLRAALDGAAFWDAPRWKDAGVDDGSMILIEGRAGGVYRSVTRWSTDARVFAAAVSLLQAAHVPVPPELEDQLLRLQKAEAPGR